MKKNLSKIISEIENFTNKSDINELQIIEELKEYFFEKLLNSNIELYEKQKKKVSEITKELKISHRRFYAILDQRNVKYSKYKKKIIKK